jgi:PEP-CTERM motif
MKKTLLLLTWLLATSSLGWANTCGMDTLAGYTASGFSCTIGDKTFSGFGYTFSASGGAIAPPAAGIDVIPCTSASPFCAVFPAGEEGFVFTSAWGVSSGQTEDSAIMYTVTSTKSVIDAFLFAGGLGASGTGTASVAETFIPNVGSLFVSNGTAPTDVITFGPVKSLIVFKGIQLSGGTSGTAAISVVANGFSQSSVLVAPEPASLVLFGSGLLALGGYSRRRQRKQRS